MTGTDPTTTSGNPPLTTLAITEGMKRGRPSPRPRPQDVGMKINGVLETIGYILLGAGIGALAPSPEILWVLSVAVALSLRWLGDNAN